MLDMFYVILIVFERILCSLLNNRILNKCFDFICIMSEQPNELLPKELGLISTHLKPRVVAMSHDCSVANLFVEIGSLMTQEGWD